MFKNRLSCAPHVRKHWLTEMPPEKAVGHMVRICGIAADGIKCSSIYPKRIYTEYHDLVVILS